MGQLVGVIQNAAEVEDDNKQLVQFGVITEVRPPSLPLDLPQNLDKYKCIRVEYHEFPDIDYFGEAIPLENNGTKVFKWHSVNELQILVTAANMPYSRAYQEMTYKLLTDNNLPRSLFTSMFLVKCCKISPVRLCVTYN